MEEDKKSMVGNQDSDDESRKAQELSEETSIADADGEQDERVKKSSGASHDPRYNQRDLKKTKALLGRVANLTEANKIVIGREALKESRDKGEEASEGGSNKVYDYIDSSKIEKHAVFQDLLPIDDGMIEDLTVDMTINGFNRAKPVLLATWEGQEKPVLIDGHTRLEASKGAGISSIPYVVEHYENITVALEQAMGLQTKRRATEDRHIFRLIKTYDRPFTLGGDRRSKNAKISSPSGELKTEPFSSARRTADLVRCSERVVSRVRRIIKDGSAELQKEVEDGKKTINQAEKEIAGRVKTKKTKQEEKAEQKRKTIKSVLNSKNYSKLSCLDGDMQDHINLAVEYYLTMPHSETTSTGNQEAEAVVDRQPDGLEDENETFQQIEEKNGNPSEPSVSHGRDYEI